MKRRATGSAAILAVLVVAGCSNPSPSLSPSTSAGASAASPATGGVLTGGEQVAAQIPQPSVSGVEVADLAERVDLAVRRSPTRPRSRIRSSRSRSQSSNLLVGTSRTSVPHRGHAPAVDAGDRVGGPADRGGRLAVHRLPRRAHRGGRASTSTRRPMTVPSGTWESTSSTSARLHRRYRRHLARRDRRTGRDDHARRSAGGRRLPRREHPRRRLRGGRRPVDRRDARRSVRPRRGRDLVEEHHSDGATETKQFAPGYGEFYTAADGEVEALAMAIPTDTASGSQPEALTSAAESATASVQAAVDGDLSQIEQSRLTLARPSAISETRTSPRCCGRC